MLTASSHSNAAAVLRSNKPCKALPPLAALPYLLQLLVCQLLIILLPLLGTEPKSGFIPMYLREQLPLHFSPGAASSPARFSSSAKAVDDFRLRTTAPAN